MGLERVRHDWATKYTYTQLYFPKLRETARRRNLAISPRTTRQLRKRMQKSDSEIYVETDTPPNLYLKKLLTYSVSSNLLRGNIFCSNHNLCILPWPHLRAPGARRPKTSFGFKNFLRMPAQSQYRTKQNKSCAQNFFPCLSFARTQPAFYSSHARARKWTACPQFKRMFSLLRLRFLHRRKAA